MTGKISHRVDWKCGAGLGFTSPWNKALKVDCQEYVRLIIFYSSILSYKHLPLRKRYIKLFKYTAHR